MLIRKYKKDDISQMINLWNEVVEDGIAFPQEDCLDEETGAEFFASQSYCGVAVDDNGEVVGLYILHPNNVGRCGHIISATRATLSAQNAEVSISAKSSCLTVSRGQRKSALRSCNSTLL